MKRIGLIIACFALSIGVRAYAMEYPTTDPTEEPTKIRCTLYIDRGTTASGEYTREGILAGKRDWLNCSANLYEVDENGNKGELIGSYEFKDTGAGIDTDGDGKGDSIRKGYSIDVWAPDMDAVREWQKTYGDYVYLEIIEKGENEVNNMDNLGYIRLNKNFFNTLEVKKISALPNSSATIIIYLKLLLLADTNGLVYYEGIFSNVEEELSVDFNETIDDINSALNELEKMQLVERVDYDLKVNKITNKRNRNTREYKVWRIAVFERDNYTCQNCGVKGARLQAHHNKPWAKYPKDRYDINNGVTLCEKCHKEKHKKEN